MNERRCSDLFIHAPDCVGGKERSQEDIAEACGQEKKNVEMFFFPCTVSDREYGLAQG